MTKQQQLSAAFAAYLQAHKNLSAQWSELNGTGEEFTRLYPFAVSFDDLTPAVEEWCNDAISKLEPVPTTMEINVSAFEAWKNSPAYNSTITLLNAKGIDYNGWSDVQLYAWHCSPAAAAKIFFWKDKTGRGYTNDNVSIDETDNEDFNWDGISLFEWAQTAEEGDEWENAESKYICTKSYRFAVPCVWLTVKVLIPS